MVHQETLCGSINKDEVNEDKVQPAYVEHLKFNMYQNNECDNGWTVNQ
jgi:hypothetical protein